MPIVRKIFPAGVHNTIENSFKLIFVAEGYRNFEHSRFLSDCMETIRNLLTIPPFNLTHSHPEWLSVYSVFESSTNSGPSVDTLASSTRTVLESELDTNTGLLNIKHSKLEGILNKVKFPLGEKSIPFTEIFSYGNPKIGGLGGLIVILLPELTTYSQGGEFENLPKEKEYYYLATTKNLEWHQIIANGLGKLLGLGIEYEISGEAQLVPNENEPIILPKNLEYFKLPPINLEDSNSKWSHLFTAHQHTQPIKVNSNISDSQPNTDISLIPTTPEKIEFWEGGGGYRKNIYRSSKDCLMRREIGNKFLPVRVSIIPLCLTCRSLLTNIINKT